MSNPVTYNGISYSAGSTLTVTVNQFDTVQLTNSNADLTGTFIRSDKKISALSKDRQPPFAFRRTRRLPVFHFTNSLS